MEILTGEGMRNVDRRAIDELGIPSLELMRTAGRGVADAILEDFPLAGSSRVLVLSGKGNNGGDGFVAAARLKQRGVNPRVVLLAPADALRGDAAASHRDALKEGVEIIEAVHDDAWSARLHLLDESDLVVDAILGTGVQGGARGLPARVIADLENSSTPVASIDLPSGINADTGTVEGVAVRALRTYTLCRPKLALVIEPAAELAGTWRVIPIGIPDEAVTPENSDLEWLDAAVARSLLPRRGRASHKGTYGHLLAVAGSRGKAGAAVLLARGALRSGVGLVTVACPASVQDTIAVQQSEVMTEALPETGPALAAGEAARSALALLEPRDALAIGPGLGTGAETHAAVLSIVCERTAPTVVDADGLNAIAEAGALARLEPAREGLVLTPHPGEAARLLGVSTAEIQSDRLGAARRLAVESGAVVVLKGHRTIVAAPDGRCAFNASGNPGMATGGTGDVLTGMLGAFLARGLSTWEGARLAVFAHGDAGDRAAATQGEDGLIAGDLVDALPAALVALRSAESPD